MTSHKEETSHRKTTINISLKTLDYDDSKNVLISTVPDVLTIKRTNVEVTLTQFAKNDVRGGASAAIFTVLARLLYSIWYCTVWYWYSDLQHRKSDHQLSPANLTLQVQYLP